MTDQPGIEELFSFWRHEGLTPLSVVRGFTELFLKGAWGLLSAEQHQAMQVIYRSALQAVHRWCYPADYLRFLNGEPHFAAGHLSEIVAAAVGYLQRNLEVGESIQLALPPDLPPVRASEGLPTALLIMLAPEEVESFSTLRAWRTADGAVRVQVQAQLARIAGQDLLESFSIPGTRLYLARSIIGQHGSELAFRHADQQATFEFSLPLWDGAAAQEQKL